MIRGYEFMAVSCFIFVSPELGSRIYTNFPVLLESIIWVIEGLPRFLFFDSPYFNLALQ